MSVAKHPYITAAVLLTIEEVCFGFGVRETMAQCSVPASQSAEGGDDWGQWYIEVSGR